MENTRHSLLKARFTYVRSELDEIVERLTQDLMDWAPAEGMRTVAGQLEEILSVEAPLVSQLRDGRHISDAEWSELVGDTGNLDSLRKGLVEVRQRTLDYLDSLSDADLARDVPCGPLWFGTFWQETMPRAEFFLNIIEHELYHVGQLISYLWARGDDPYKW